METSTEAVCKRASDEEPQKRWLEKIISGPFAGSLRRFAPVVVCVFLLMLIPFTILAADIQPISRSEESLPEDHPFQRMQTISGSEFPSSASNENIPVHLVWGVSGMNQNGVSLLRDPKFRGTLEWDDSFAFDEAAQRHIFAICEEVRRMEAPGLANFLSRDDEAPGKPGWVDCPLFDWRDWLERSGGPGFPLPLAQVAEEMAQFLQTNYTTAWGTSTSMREKWQGKLGFDSSLGAVRVVVVSVHSQLASGMMHSRSQLLEHYEHFESWISELNSASGRLSAPATAAGAFQVSEGDFNGPNWVWMHTQSIFIRTAVSGAVAGSLVAFVVILIATRQLLIALSAFATIACILISVLAMMRIAGY